MLLFKHGRNRSVAFGMLMELLLLALIHQVAGDVPPEPSEPLPVAVVPSAANTVGFGRHTKSGEKVKLSSGDWGAAASPEDLKPYKEAGALNPCYDIEYEKETGNIIVKYRKDGLIKYDGCMVDLLTKYTTSVSFIIGIKNSNGLEHCLDEPDKYAANCGWFSCDWPYDYLKSSHANTLPFIYSRTVAEFQLMRNYEPASGDGCPASCSGNVFCRKWTGLAAGFGKYLGKVVRTVVGIGDPGGSSCGLATATAGNDANYKITVDNGNMHWFKSEGCTWEEGAFPRDTRCVNKNSMAQELGEKITWEIEGSPDSDFKQLFTFALLPNTATKAHSSEVYKIYGDGLGGPSCDEIYVKFPGNSFKLLVPAKKGGGLGIVIVIVLIVAVVSGVLVFFFVIKKSTAQNQSISIKFTTTNDQKGMFQTIFNPCSFDTNRDDNPPEFEHQYRLRIAYHEAAHAVVSWHLPDDLRVKNITIVRTKQYYGKTEYHDSSSPFYLKNVRLARMTSMLAGRAVEQEYFNSPSDGSAKDIEIVNDMAREYVLHYGFEHELGFISYKNVRSESSNALMEETMRNITKRCFQHACELVKAHIDVIHNIVTVLMEEKTLEGPRLYKLLGVRPVETASEGLKTNSSKTGRVINKAASTLYLIFWLLFAMMLIQPTFGKSIISKSSIYWPCECSQQYLINECFTKNNKNLDSKTNYALSIYSAHLNSTISFAELLRCVISCLRFLLYRYSCKSNWCFSRCRISFSWPFWFFLILFLYIF
uniref:Peptidase M41 domain-containing protein n=1 Tax=Meloidogyne incognita TaxID=6306 RepID=A0A914MDN0_MELIC